jgi:aspartate ammonia-lyase
MVKWMSYRVEKDSLGVKEIPSHAYYGIQTIRAVENFPITGMPVQKEIILALAHVKKAAAQANIEQSLISASAGNAIIKAAEEVITGELNDQFMVDCIQGGAGTSINMNMNEVLANRALELMGHNKGEYAYCSPNTVVNMSQSTNDTIPTAIKIAAYFLSLDLLKVLRALKEGFDLKAKEFDTVIKMGRTHLQDAVPIRLGQEFSAYANVLERDIYRIQRAADELLYINLGATAIGTSLNANEGYTKKVIYFLSEQLGLSFQHPINLIDSTQNTDCYTDLSSCLKICSVNLSKICNDIRLMASGPKAGLSELVLQPRQPGSSIMPGKVNPVMAEVVNQMAFQVIGNDHTICMASEAGQFELNVMVPVLSFNLLQSLTIMKNTLHAFHEHALKNIDANKERCEKYVRESFGVITALNPYLGYEKAAMVVNEAVKTNSSIATVCIANNLFSKDELEKILDPIEMTSPGIAGQRQLVKQTF